MNTFSKIIIGSLVVTFSFGIFGYIAETNLSINTASAYVSGGGGTGCSGCGSYDDGNGGSISGGGGSYTPTVCNYLNASTTSVPYGGGNVTLNWSTTGASSASISGIGNVTPASGGSHTVSVNSNTTFTLTVNGPGGSDSCAVTITVEQPSAAKCVSFTANVSSVSHNGGNITLSWNTQNASSASINQGVGTVTPTSSGSKTVFVDSTKTYTLTVTGAGGNDSCTVTVTVNQTPAAKCLTFNTNKTKVDYNGETVTLSWTTENADSVSISGIGNVSKNGSISKFVNSNTTFTLTVNGSGGNDNCVVQITTETYTVTPECHYLNASDYNVEEGDRITLTWDTSEADYVTITPQVGTVSSNGSKNVTVYNDTTFTLRARDTQTGDEDSCTVKVYVEEEEEEKTPRCDLEISDDRVKKGDEVTLSWDTTNVDEIRIEDDRGNTVFESDSRRYMDGEIDVIINRDTEFTLEAEGEDGGDRTCRVDVEVDDDITVYEKREQGTVIALTQVPYTGFEAGPFLTFLFYALLTLWALFVAYVLVIKKSSILGFSLYGATGAAAQTDVENRKKVEALVAKYQGQNQ